MATTTLLRNSLLAQSSYVPSTPTDLSQVIPPPLPNLPNATTPSTDNTAAALAQANTYGTGVPSTKPTPLGEFNKLYNKLQTDAGRGSIGNDPFLQKDAINKINDFLKRYPNTQANPDYAEDAVKPWTELPVITLYTNTIKTLIDVINDIADSISQNQVDGSVATRRKIVMALFKPERRIYVGFLLIFFSFVLYFIDSAA